MGLAGGVVGFGWIGLCGGLGGLHCIQCAEGLEGQMVRSQEVGLNHLRSYHLV